MLKYSHFNFLLLSPSPENNFISYIVTLLIFINKATKWSGGILEIAFSVNHLNSPKFKHK